jgi:putative membrane protein
MFESFLPLIYFIAYFFAGMMTLALFIWCYLHTTPIHEIDLIKKGNTAAAVTLSAAALGFAIPLAKVIAQSVGPLDFVIWAVVAAILQIAGFRLAMKVSPKLCDRIIEGQISDAIIVAVMSISIGLINSASMSL